MSAVTLTLDDREQAYLATLLDSDLRETRVALRRTDTPDYHDELNQRDKMLCGLLERLRGDRPAGGAAPRP